MQKAPDWIWTRTFFCTSPMLTIEPPYCLKGTCCFLLYYCYHCIYLLSLQSFFAPPLYLYSVFNLSGSIINCDYIVYIYIYVLQIIIVIFQSHRVLFDVHTLYKLSFISESVWLMVRMMPVVAAAACILVVAVKTPLAFFGEDARWPRHKAWITGGPVSSSLCLASLYATAVIPAPCSD